MITTDSAEIAERIRLFRRDGMSDEEKYYHTVIGYNYRLTNLQAAFGLAQLERFDDIIEKKRRNADHYQERLADTNIDHSIERDWAKSVFWMFNIIPENQKIKNQIESDLADADIETRPIFKPLSEQPPYTNATVADMRVADSVSERGLSLPSGAPLTEEEIDVICSVVSAAIN